MTQSTAALSAMGHELDLSPDAFGYLRSSIDLLDDPPALRARMEEDGYLFLPGYLDVDQVLDARRVMCEKLDAQGLLDRDHDLMEAICKQAPEQNFMPKLAENNPPLMRLLYSGRMMAFYEELLGSPVLHYDYTWCRAVPYGQATWPHCDSVYMGRGSQRVFTSWTPIGDVSMEDGGLMVMEKSHHIQPLRENYCRTDVDAYCVNRQGEDHQLRKQNPTFGVLTKNPARLRENLGLRWLTSDYRAGDVLILTMFTVHASIDNRGRRIRISTDSRYQPAGEPVDDRWISIEGKPPKLHGQQARRELIC